MQLLKNIFFFSSRGLFDCSQPPPVLQAENYKAELQPEIFERRTIIVPYS